LVRNCCDHALETPSEREAAGKNRQGNVYLRSYVQSGEIILEVQDDGRGISAEYVCAKAIQKGIITSEDAESMTEDQKVMLIFAAGFSTKDTATDVSGRGVGMDVVRNNIEKVGGTIEVRTKVGEGSVFAARLPLAKALVASSLTAALIVEVHGEKLAVPETAVSEIIRCDSRTASSVHQVDGRDVYQLRDQLIALIDLREPLDLCEESTCDTQVRLANMQPGDSRCLVVLQYRNHLFGTIVDNVIGIQEIIVRSTPKLLADCTIYSGHTILGTGRVALILDVNGIVTKMGLEFTSRAKKAAVSQSADRRSSNTVPDVVTTQKMLLFNYSHKEYFAIPLELVALIERVSKTDLQLVGTNEFCQFKSETISVMRLDNFLPITKLDPNQQEFCLIRPTAIEYPIGILTGSDVSVLEVADNFESRLDDGRGVVGTFMHQDRLVMMLDLFSLFEKHAPDKLKIEDDNNQKATILIAEDSLFFRKLIAQYIQKPNWTVDIVTDGLEAWERLQSQPGHYNLVISDINMPRMDGFELAVKVREDRRFDSMPMVALTTMSDEHFRKKGLALGFDRYVIKIDKREVRSTVAECLKIRRTKK
jgi:two-component system chemotaxis sensor kinase CheA